MRDLPAPSALPAHCGVGQSHADGIGPRPLCAGRGRSADDPKARRHSTTRGRLDGDEARNPAGRRTPRASTHQSSTHAAAAAGEPVPRQRSRSALKGTEAPEGLRHPNRGGASPPIDRKRPSDGRSPGMDPGPQGAFEVSMINVSCNSHYFSQLAAFFIDARAE